MSTTTENLVVIEYMPMWLRDSHDAASNSGQYPHNGAIRYTMHADDAACYLDDEWCRIVRGANPARYELHTEIPE